MEITTRTMARAMGVALILAVAPAPARAEAITNAIRAYLLQRGESQRRDAAFVVGLVDERSSKTVGWGRSNDGTGPEVSGDTPFAIGSVTKTFTALLLQEMVVHGEMDLDDPVGKYLPGSVKAPTLNGKQITLRQLVLHTSGLPPNPGNLGPTWGDYPTEKLYAFLSGYELWHEPGARYEYSNLGASLLGHLIELKAGTNYESLVVDRICRPLNMRSTRIATDSDRSPVFNPQGGLSSTANDLLKFASAHVRLTRSSLTPAIEKAKKVQIQPGAPDQNLGSWFVVADPQGRRFVLHDGDAGGCSAFVVLDEARRRGVAALCFPGDANAVADVGRVLIESEWIQENRPKEAEISDELLDGFLGRYQRRDATGASPPSGLGIRREGSRIMAQTSGSRAWPMRALIPGLEGELLAQSETRLFARLSGMSITSGRDSRGNVLGLTVEIGRDTYYYERISEQPPDPLQQDQGLRH